MQLLEHSAAEGFHLIFVLAGRQAFVTVTMTKSAFVVFEYVYIAVDIDPVSIHPESTTTANHVLSIGVIQV